MAEFICKTGGPSTGKRWEIPGGGSKASMKSKQHRGKPKYSAGTAFSGEGEKHGHIFGYAWYSLWTHPICMNSYEVN